MEKETITIRNWEMNFILTVNPLNVIMDLINLTNITSAILLFLQSITECFSELKLSVKRQLDRSCQNEGSSTKQD